MPCDNLSVSIWFKVWQHGTGLSQDVVSSTTLPHLVANLFSAPKQETAL